MLLKNQLDSIYKVHIIDVGHPNIAENVVHLTTSTCKKKQVCHMTLKLAGQPANQCKQMYCSIDVNFYCGILD